MLKKEIKLRIVTPMMVGGFSFKQGQNTIIDTHLNVNSIRGALRWWFRSLLGWNKNLIDKESQIFGSTKQASSVKFKLSHLDLRTQLWDENRFQTANCFGNYKIKFKRNNQEIVKNIPFNGFKYLSFYNKFPEQRNVYTIHKYYDVNQQFTLTLFATNEEIFKKAIYIMWLWLQFGGLGYHSRRGFGKLEIINPFSLNDFEFQNCFSNKKEYQNIVKKNLNQIKACFNPSGNNTIPFLHNSNLYTCFEKGDTWQEALNLAGATMQKFRTRLNPDYTNLRNRFGRNAIPLVKPIFGLPIRFKFSSIPKKGSINNFHQNEETRLASPILISIVKIGEFYYPQFLILNFDYGNKMLDIRINAKFRGNQQNANVSIASNAVSQFINHLQSFKINSTSYNYTQIF